MRVFLTGGTGLIGSHIAERLRAAGHDVVALVRPASRRGFLEGLGARLVVGDLLDPEGYRGALVGCDAAVHAAAILVERAGWEAYHRTNVEGTRRFFEAAVSAGVGRALHVSTVAVYGGVGGIEGPIREETSTGRPVPAEEVYARSKRMAEAVAWDLHRAGAIDVRVVRPSLSYGERDRIVLPRVARYLRMPVVFLIGSGTNPLPLVYAGNVAEGAVLALTRPEASGGVYNLTGDFPVTQREFFSRVAEGLGLRKRFLPLPYGMAYGLAALLERAAPGFTARSGLNRRRISFIGTPNPFVSERARRELGWTPSVGPEEAIARAVRWYRAEGRGREGFDSER